MKINYCLCQLWELETIAARLKRKDGRFRSSKRREEEYMAFRQMYEAFLMKLWQKAECKGSFDPKKIYVSPDVHDLMRDILPEEWHDELLPNYNLDLPVNVAEVNCKE